MTKTTSRSQASPSWTPDCPGEVPLRRLRRMFKSSAGSAGGRTDQDDDDAPALTLKHKLKKSCHMLHNSIFESFVLTLIWVDLICVSVEIIISECFVFPGSLQDQDGLYHGNDNSFFYVHHPAVKDPTGPAWRSGVDMDLVAKSDKVVM